MTIQLQVKDKKVTRHHFKINDLTGVNLSGSPADIPNDKVLKMENYMPIIGKTLKKVPSYTTRAPSPVLGSNIIRIFPAYVGGALGTIKAILVLILADGSAHEYNVASEVTTLIFAAATFQTSPGRVPRMAQFRQERVLFVDSSAGIHDWDGTTATVSAGSITGHFIEVYEDRVFVATIDTNALQISKPSSYTDFTTASGGGTFQINHPSLQGNITAIMATTDVLYLFGANATLVVSNVQLQGGILQFSVVPLYANVGCEFPDSIARFENQIYVMDSKGIHQIAGFSHKKISDPDIDGILPDLKNVTFSPIGFIGTLYNINFYGLLVSITEPGLSNAEKRMFCFYNKGWFTINISALDTLFIANTFQVSGIDYNFTSDTTNLRRFFDVNSTVKIKTKIKTKRYDFGNEMVEKDINKLFIEVDELSGTLNFTGMIVGKRDSVFSLSVTSVAAIQWQNDSMLDVDWQNDDPAAITWINGAGLIEGRTRVEGRGTSLAVELEEDSNLLFELNKMQLEYFYRERVY